MLLVVRPRHEAIESTQETSDRTAPWLQEKSRTSFVRTTRVRYEFIIRGDPFSLNDVIVERAFDLQLLDRITSESISQIIIKWVTANFLHSDHGCLRS